MDVKKYENKCPNCGSKNIMGYTSTKAPSMKRKYYVGGQSEGESCGNCMATWRIEYKITGFTNLEK